MSCQDAPEPIELALTNDANAFDPFAGNVLTLSMGSPPQQLRFTPATTFINSAAHIVPPCNETTDPDCSANRYGGIYDSTKSQTYAAAPFNSWNGSHNAGQTTLTSTYFNDILNLNDAKALTSFPMVTLDTTFDFPNVFGIGPNSTLIEQTYSSGLIPSRSWSLYAGNSTSPGSLILGGYSSHFIDGEMKGRVSDPSCQICFQVSSISLDSPQGSIPILTAGQDTFLSQLEPFGNYLAFPNAIFENWMKMTNAIAGKQDFAAYKNDSVPAGDLTITFSSGLVVTIPHRDLFTSNRIIGDGTTFKPVPGNQVAKIRRTQMSTGAFGFPFLSQVYVIYDSDRQTVNMSKAVPNAQSDGRITRICPLASGPTQPNSNSTVPSTPQTSSGSNTGAIAGGAVGGVIALLLAIIAVVFLVLRHRRRNARHRPMSDASDSPLEKDSNSYAMSYFGSPSKDQPAYRQVTRDPVEAYARAKVEMPGDVPPQELPSSNLTNVSDLMYERYELPADPAAGAGTMTSWGSSTLSSNQGAAGSTPSKMSLGRNNR